MIRRICLAIFRFVAPLALTLVSRAQAQGLQVVETTASNVFDTFDSIGVVIVAIAVIVAGFLLLFRAVSWGIAAGIIIGGVLIGSATEIAEWITGGSAGA